MRSARDVQQDVLAELEWEPSLDAGGIGASVTGGVVTLSGHVKSYAEKKAAERAVKRVAGVEGIANDLVVKPLATAVRDDTDIAEVALRNLKWNVLVPAQRIRVMVDHGWITLEGEVDWQFERTEAEKAVGSLSGVHGVTNEIVVKPRVAPEAVQDKIRSAFRRHADLDAERVHVEVLGSKVTLRGKVRSWGEFEQAEWSAWSAPGVTQVKNELRVEEEAAALV